MSSVLAESMSPDRARALLDDALKGADDGELFLEYRLSESFVFDDGRMKSASFDTTQGFGLRAVAGEAISSPSEATCACGRSRPTTSTTSSSW